MKGEIGLRPIGVIHSPFATLDDMPIQARGAHDVPGEIEVFEEFGPGLTDLEGFSHIIILYHFHRSSGYELAVTPFLDDQPRGLFSTRAPRRPNPIGLSVVRLVHREGSVLQIKDVDVLNGTPLLDIKPYVPAFDAVNAERVGWLEGKTNHLKTTRSDDRFVR